MLNVGITLLPKALFDLNALRVGVGVEPKELAPNIVGTSATVVVAVLVPNENAGAVNVG